VTHRAGELIGHEHRGVAVDDLERERLVVRARNAGEVALDLRIARQPVFLVLDLFLQCFGRVGELVAFDDAEPARHRADGAEREHFLRGNRRHGTGPHRQRRPRAVRLDIPVGGIDRLPDAVQVRPAVEARNAGRSRLPGDRRT
jgi:hypothetical protein